MRCTRQKQISKSRKLRGLSYYPNRCIPTQEMRKILFGIGLDKSFKWHREEGCVSFSEKIFGRVFVTELTIHNKQPIKLF